MKLTHGKNKMYKRRLLIPLIVLTLIVNLAACKKTCYHCEALYATGKCVRTMDTTYFITYNYVDLIDTLSSFTNQGYTCGVADSFWSPYFIGVDNRYCGKEEYEMELSYGDRCRPIE